MAQDINCKGEIDESFQFPKILIDRNTSMEELESLQEGQLVLDENSKLAVLQEIEIKQYMDEKHIYIRLSSMPKSILIIKEYKLAKNK